MAAHIQQSVLRGLTPGGVEFIAPAAAPALRQVISGVDIQDPSGLADLTGKSGFADAGPALQITVPGTADAVVAIKLFGRDGQKALPGGGVVTAKAGSVTEVPLAGVPAGPYTVAVSSDVSFTAAARVTRGLKDDDASDFAWSPASARLGSQHVVPVPGSGSATSFSAPPRAGPPFPTRRSRPTARSTRPRRPTSRAAPPPPSRYRATSRAHRSSATSCPPREIPPTARSCCRRGRRRTSRRWPLPRGQRARSRSRSHSATDRAVRSVARRRLVRRRYPGTRAARRASRPCTPPRRRGPGPGVPRGCRRPARRPGGTG